VNRLASILDSKRPAVQLARPEDIVVSRKWWDEMLAELGTLRARLACVEESPKRRTHPEIERLLAAAFMFTGQDREAVLGRSKYMPLPDLRMAIYVVARGKEIDRAAIAQSMRRTTNDMGHWEKRATALIETDAKFRELVAKLEAACS
jgi:hypothetical protein